MITTRGSDLAVVGPLARAMTLAGAIALLLPGCRCGELTPLPLTSPCPPELVVGAVAPASEPIPIPIPCPRPVDPAQLLARSADARAAALRAELRDDPSSVDSYYASAA
ncbi:MAG: hypothetical protein U0794_22015 [Isosphaeraceae bacterium]